MTWPFVGEDLQSLLKTLCRCGRVLDALECFEYIHMKSQIEALRQATKEAAMDERFEDALSLKKQRIELEAKTESFSEAQTRWRGMPNYQSTMYHLRRQVEKIALTDEKDDICKSFLSRYHLPPVPLTCPDTYEDGAHDTLRKLAENQRKALFAYHVIFRLESYHVKEWNRILDAVFNATRDAVKTVSSLKNIKDENIVQTIQKKSEYDRFMSSVASMHTVANLIHVAADAISCKSVLERLDEIKSLSDSIKMFETRNEGVTFEQWSEYASREILADGKFCCISLVPMGNNIPRHSPSSEERPYVVTGNRVYYSLCAKILIALSKK